MNLATKNIVDTEGAEWKQRRKILSGAFNFEYLRGTIPLMIDSAQEKFAEWIKRGELTDQNLVERLSLITGDVVGKFYVW